MCGIFGIFTHSPNHPPPRRQLEASARYIAHRGPDHTGIHSAPGVGLVHARLSLVDPSPRSHQPLWDVSRRYCLIYNGEVYNYRELRRHLEGRGIAFQTSGDTEVVLQSLIHYGRAQALDQFDGMFALALYDAQEDTLCLARDRFGIKPLFLNVLSTSFLFSSEVPAFRPWTPIEPDFLTVSGYVHGFHGGPMGGGTFYRDVKQVPPGALLTLSRGGQVHEDTFSSLSDLWDPPYHEELRRCKPVQVADRLEECLIKSVERQLAADAPIGALCSGGVDSALILAVACRLRKGIEVFHADVLGSQSEHGAAVAVARHLRLDLRTVAISDIDFIEHMPEVMMHYGQPYVYHPNSPPFLLVSHLARQHGVKAVLSGEGADEAFLGYPRLLFDIRKVVGITKTPLALWRALRSSTKRGRVPSSTPDHTYAVADLFNRFETVRAREHVGATLFRDLPATTPHKYLLTLQEFGYHLRTLLHRNDTLGMAASIESRFPYLDHALVRLAVNMPYDCKVRPALTVMDRSHYGLVDKWVLRTVASRYLPKALSHRRKRGFLTSVQKRMTVDADLFRDSFVAHLFSMTSAQTRYMCERASRDLQHRLLHLEVWGQLCVWEKGAPSVLAKLREYVRIAPEPV